MTDANVRVVYEFAGFRADPLTRRLSTGGQALHLTPKAFETLLVLIENRGDVIPKQSLMDAVWADTAVEENNLTQQIAALRRAFGERAGEHRFIVTAPGKGYRFVAPVSEVEICAGDELIFVEASRSTVTIDIDGGVSFKLPKFFRRASVQGYSLAAAYAFIVCMLAFWPMILGSTFDAGPQTIAVMNFRTTAVEDEALGAGIRDTLRARLGNLEDVAVRPTRSDIPPEDAVIAGRVLDADVVFTGSIQREHDRVRVAVEIVDVRSLRIVWGRTFDCNSSETFELQDAIAGEAIRAITATRL